MRPRVPLTPARAEAVIRRAGALWGLAPECITGPARTVEAAAARQACMYALRHATVSSLTTIGRLIGGRDHTTVMHGLAAAEAAAIRDPEAALRLTDLLQTLQEA